MTVKTPLPADALEQLVCNLPIAAALFDSDMRYLFANKRWMQDFHLGASDLLGRSHYDVFPEISADWKAIHRHCLQGHSHRDAAVRFPRSSGEEDWLRREIHPWYDIDGSVGGLVIYADVITEQYRAESELLRQRNFLRQVIDLNTSFIFAKDGDGRFTLVNQALATHYGTTPEAMVGKYDEDFNPNLEETSHFRREDREVIEALTHRFVPEESVTNVVTGEKRWYQTIKVPLSDPETGEVQLLGVATDITDRKRAQDEIDRQRLFLRQVIDLNTSYIFAKDAEGRFTLVNKALADDFGVHPDETIGKYDVDFNPIEEEVANIRADDLEVLRTRKAKFIPEEPITSAVTGRTRWFQTVKVPLIGNNDDHVQLLGVATDITERKHAQETLARMVDREKELREQAEASVKAKDTFVATMSHELRTPMNAIIGFLREMLYSSQLDHDNIHLAQRCLANSKRLLNLINSVLDMSRIAGGGLELVALPIDLNEVIPYAIEDLRVQAEEKGLALSWSIADDLPIPVIHDEDRLTQIIVNLVINAIKYTDVGYVHVNVERQEQRLLIQILDTGVGIEPDVATHIFEPFVQAEGARVRGGGAGLGLSIVHQLTTLMGGSVTFSSESGTGSKFIVDLPLDLAAMEQGT